MAAAIVLANGPYILDRSDEMEIKLKHHVIKREQTNIKQNPKEMDIHLSFINHQDTSKKT